MRFGGLFVCGVAGSVVSERTSPINSGTTAAVLPADFPPFTGEQLCAQVDPEFMFPATHDGAKAQKRLCRNCSFLQSCGTYALAHPKEQGVWGGMTENDRRDMRRRLRVPVAS